MASHIQPLHKQWFVAFIVLYLLNVREVQHGIQGQLVEFLRGVMPHIVAILAREEGHGVTREARGRMHLLRGSSDVSQLQGKKLYIE